MKKFHDLSIHKKLTLIIMGMTLSTLLIVNSVVIIYDIFQIRTLMSDGLSNSARLLANRSSAALIFNDEELATENLEALAELPHVNLGCMYQQSGDLFASYRRPTSDDLNCPVELTSTESVAKYTTQYIHVSFPILSEDENFGHIYLRTSLEPINARIFQLIYVVSGLIGVVGLLALWVSRRLQAVISRPIASIANVAKKIEEEGDYSKRSPVKGNDEVAQMSAAFNAMLETIEQQNAQLTDAKNNLELQVRNRTRELEIANKELESFSYTVSHDLRAPLRAISGFSNILLEDHLDSLDDEAQKLLGNVVNNAERMRELISDLLELSQIGRKKLNREKINFSALVLDLQKNLESNAQGANVQFHCEDLGIVLADRGLLKVVMENLLGNAWKYSSKTNDAKIEVGQCRLNNEDVFFVRDNGAGFDMALVEKIFNVFQRLHRAEEFEGTGVGLATVERIIQMHGGRIWAESEVGKGATFYFTIPN